MYCFHLLSTFLCAATTAVHSARLGNTLGASIEICEHDDSCSTASSAPPVLPEPVNFRFAAETHAARSLTLPPPDVGSSLQPISSSGLSSSLAASYSPLRAGYSSHSSTMLPLTTLTSPSIIIDPLDEWITLAPSFPSIPTAPVVTGGNPLRGAVTTPDPPPLDTASPRPQPAFTVTVITVLPGSHTNPAVSTSQSGTRSPSINYSETSVSPTFESVPSSDARQKSMTITVSPGVPVAASVASAASITYNLTNTSPNADANVTDIDTPQVHSSNSGIVKSTVLGGEGGTKIVSIALVDRSCLISISVCWRFSIPP